MTDAPRFALTQDEEYHWYVIPEGRADELFNILYPRDSETNGVTPDWAIMLPNGLGDLTFGPDIRMGDESLFDL